jgi:hypothetical protein
MTGMKQSVTIVTASKYCFLLLFFKSVGGSKLHTFIKSTLTNDVKSQLSGKHCGVDMMGIIHRSIPKSSTRLVFFSDSKAVVEDIISHVRAIASLAKRVILVYDGDSMPGKAETKGLRSVDLDALYRGVQANLETDNYLVSNSTKNGKGDLDENQENRWDYFSRII